MPLCARKTFQLLHVRGKKVSSCYFLFSRCLLYFIFYAFYYFRFIYCCLMIKDSYLGKIAMRWDKNEELVIKNETSK